MKDKGTAIYWEGEKPNYHNADRHYARWTIDVVEGYITQRANDYSELTLETKCVKTEPFWLDDK